MLDQYQIVSSRIALECFFDMIHIAESGERMPGDKKFKVFRKWVVGKDNPYKYFVGHIINAFDFSREQRDPLVHGTSRFVHSILQLKEPEFIEKQNLLNLHNILLNTWPPFIQMLNGIRPASIGAVPKDFAKQYFDGRSDEESFSSYVAELVNQQLK